MVIAKRRCFVVIIGAAVAWLVQQELCRGFFLLTILNNSFLHSAYLKGRLLEFAIEVLLPSSSTATEPEPVPELEVRNCSPQSFLALSKGGTGPVVLRGVHAESSILGWTPRRLLELFGNESSLQLERRIDPTQPDESFGTRMEMYLAGKIRQVNQVFFARRHRDLRARILNELGGSLARNCAGHGDVWVPPIAMTLNVYRAYANQSTGVSWHAHNIEAPSTVHVRGEKSWILVAPEYTPLLKPETSLWGAVLFAQGNPYSYVDWDPVAHMEPLLSRIPRMSATLGAGDVLFVPTGWWHSTANAKTDEDVISLVFSHISAGPTLLRTYAPYAILSWFNIIHVACLEVVDHVKGWTSFQGMFQ